MFKVQYKVKKVTVLENGEVKKKFVPICKKSLFGFGFWRECSEWEEIEKKIAEGKREGGKEKKRAVFAENMKTIAKKHSEGKHAAKKHVAETKSHKAIGRHEGYMIGMKKKGRK